MQDEPALERGRCLAAAGVPLKALCTESAVPRRCPRSGAHAGGPARAAAVRHQAGAARGMPRRPAIQPVCSKHSSKPDDSMLSPARCWKAAAPSSSRGPFPASAPLLCAALLLVAPLLPNRLCFALCPACRATRSMAACGHSASRCCMRAGELVRTGARLRAACCFVRRQAC